MMVKRYRVRLAEEEQQGLKSLVPKGRVAAYRQTHARILLLCDENQVGGAMKDEEIARALKVGTATVERVRRRGVEEGLKAALGRRQQLNRRQRKLDGGALVPPATARNRRAADGLRLSGGNWPDGPKQVPGEASPVARISR